MSDWAVLKHSRRRLFSCVAAKQRQSSPENEVGKIVETSVILKQNNSIPTKQVHPLEIYVFKTLEPSWSQEFLQDSIRFLLGLPNNLANANMQLVFAWTEVMRSESLSGQGIIWKLNSFVIVVLYLTKSFTNCFIVS